MFQDLRKEGLESRHQALYLKNVDILENEVKVRKTWRDSEKSYW